MIYDKLCNVLNYKGIHPNLDIALDYIHAHLDEMPETIELKGNDVRAFKCAYETVPERDAFFEAHAQFADIQILRSGREKIGVSHISVLEVEEAKPEQDFWRLCGPEEASLVMDDSVFVIVLPGDAHKLKVQLHGPEAVNKTVFKVKMV